jgi:hypothetical protein
MGTPQGGFRLASELVPAFVLDVSCRENPELRRQYLQRRSALFWFLPACLYEWPWVLFSLCDFEDVISAVDIQLQFHGPIRRPRPIVGSCQGHSYGQRLARFRSCFPKSQFLLISGYQRMLWQRSCGSHGTGRSAIDLHHETALEPEGLKELIPIQSVMKIQSF